MSRIHYVIVMDGSPYRPMFEHMLQDVADQEDVSIVVDTPRKLRGKRLLYKYKVQKLTGGCLEFLLYERNELYSCLERVCPSSERVCVIFLNAALWHNPYLADTLRRYRKKWSNLHYVLYYLDVVGAGVSRCADYLRKKGVFDLIYSYRQADAQQYGLLPWNTIYSSNISNRSIQPARDLYFCCGVSKERLPLIESCLAHCQEQAVDSKMDLVCYTDTPSLAQYQPMVRLLCPDQVLNYTQVLQQELQAQCLLEIVPPGRQGLTLRPYEAVVYNRKLLTNNKSILSFEYYDPAFMQYFDKIEDIDWQWVKEKTPVDYGYRGNFSPTLLLEDIAARLG